MASAAVLHRMFTHLFLHRFATFVSTSGVGVEITGSQTAGLNQPILFSYLSITKRQVYPPCTHTHTHQGRGAPTLSLSQCYLSLSLPLPLSVSVALLSHSLSLALSLSLTLSFSLKNTIILGFCTCLSFSLCLALTHFLTPSFTLTLTQYLVSVHGCNIAQVYWD